MMTMPLHSGGLSPRVRGNPNPRCQVCGQTGSIPARAGEPHTALIGECWHGVYPRACGGTQNIYAALAGATGLSPRVRGNPRSLTARLSGLWGAGSSELHAELYACCRRADTASCYITVRYLKPDSRIRILAISSTRLQTIDIP